MRKKIILKSLLVIFIFTGILGILPYFSKQDLQNQNRVVSTLSDKTFGWKFPPVAKFPLTGSNTRQIAYSDIRDPGGVPQGLPVRLKIPVIGVDTAIEDALITSDGRMDVPIGSVNVAWFSLGPHPGNIGSAVIGGHFGISNGVPWVFYNLDKLKSGDKVYILDDKGNTLAFMVRSIKSFDRNADSSTVFTSSDGIAHLNLITCEGVWNQVNGTYPLRLVIFTDAIPAEGAVEVTKPRIATKAIPIPTISLTSAPEELTTSTNIKKNSLPTPKILIASAKSLYGTPLDGLLTSLLLFSIVFITFKIIRR